MLNLLETLAASESSIQFEEWFKKIYEISLDDDFETSRISTIINDLVYDLSYFESDDRIRKDEASCIGIEEAKLLVLNSIEKLLQC